MTYPTQFADWLQLAALDGRGGLAAEPPSISRGRTRVFTLNLAEHADYTDWTGGAFAANIKASPDAAGAALASFTCVIGTPASGVTPVTLTLDEGDQSGLPADSDGDGVTECFLEVTFTPTAGDADTIISTRILVSGVI